MPDIIEDAMIEEALRDDHRSEIVDQKKIVRLFKSGCSIRQISAGLGVHPWEVTVAIRRALP